MHHVNHRDAWALAVQGVHAYVCSRRRSARRVRRRRWTTRRRCGCSATSTVCAWLRAAASVRTPHTVARPVFRRLSHRRSRGSLGAGRCSLCPHPRVDTLVCAPQASRRSGRCAGRDGRRRGCCAASTSTSIPTRRPRLPRLSALAPGIGGWRGTSCAGRYAAPVTRQRIVAS